MKRRRDETQPSMQYEGQAQLGIPSTGRAVWLSPITRPTRRLTQ